MQWNICLGIHVEKLEKRGPKCSGIAPSTHTNPNESNLHLQGLSREWKGMDGLLGVAGIIINIVDHSLIPYPQGILRFPSGSTRLDTQPRRRVTVTWPLWFHQGPAGNSGLMHPWYNRRCCPGRVGFAVFVCVFLLVMCWWITIVSHILHVWYIYLQNWVID